jgi:hypothetical protein
MLLSRNMVKRALRSSLLVYQFRIDCESENVTVPWQFQNGCTVLYSTLNDLSKSIGSPSQLSSSPCSLKMTDYQSINLIYYLINKVSKKNLRELSFQMAQELCVGKCLNYQSSKQKILLCSSIIELSTE